MAFEPIVYSQSSIQLNMAFPIFSPVFFNNLKNEGVDLSNPKDVGPALRTGNAIIYRIELCKYTMGSKAIEVALRSYDSILPTMQ